MQTTRDLGNGFQTALRGTSNFREPKVHLNKNQLPLGPLPDHEHSGCSGFYFECLHVHS